MGCPTGLATLALTGHAFLALWNDIARDREPEYDQWHTLEHVPERVSVNGFYGARRYVNRARQNHRYFTLYDVESLATFESREYVDLLDHPTPWSASMRPDFSNFLRSVCTVVTTDGTGIGAAIAVLCLPRETPDAAIASSLATARVLPRMTSVHLGRTATVASIVPFTQPPPETAPMRRFDRIALLEALDRDAAARALASVQEALDLTLPADFGADVYDLAFVFPGADSSERLRHRRPGWNPASR
jgi:hypothetical protein